MKKKSTQKTPRRVEQYAHADKERVNNPPVGLVTTQTDPPNHATQTYQYDPHFDPQLQWTGKAERTSFEVPTQSLHVHERIDPRRIIAQVQRKNGAATGGQESLFEQPAQNPPLREAVQFYQHAHNWSNRLIAGDSLLVMNSLLQKESMASKVQCVYMDPPYGIKYGSNFQPFVGEREVKDGKDEDLTAEPEMIKAFRDTWELGIHSYLSYMRDRLLLAKELLTDSGSCFVQIGDENVHRVGLLMDDIFGAENRVATISYMTTGSSAAKTLPEVADYLLWYAKDKTQVKYRQLYEPLTRREIIELFTWHAEVELANGETRKLTDEERFDPDKFLPKDARIYRRMRLASQGGGSNTERTQPYEWNGRVFQCIPSEQWRISKAGLDKLAEIRRLAATENQSLLAWKRYEDEVPGRKINNVWARQMSVSDKRYVVQTADSVLQRCILMSTDPGDLVFDPTCGSGVTAYNAEKWGRRWITCDTSRVATTLAKQRLMTTTFDYYQLAYPDEGAGSGFKYESVRYVSAAKLGYDEPISYTTLFDRPLKDTKKVRVTGPFTMEAVPAPTVQPLHDVAQQHSPADATQASPPTADASIARSGETVRQQEWRDELLQSGIRGKGGQRISFSRVEPLPCRWLHADAETKADDRGATNLQEPPATAYQTQRAVISFAPEHAALEQRQVENALQEAQNLIPKPSIVAFAAFQFDPEAAKDIDETRWGDTAILKVHMNADMQTDDLKKNRANNESFWLIGQPDIELRKLTEGDAAGKYQVEVHGFDYFNTKTGQIEPGDQERIAIWMLDTDYDNRSIYPNQVFFPMAGEQDGWAKLARTLSAEIDADLIEAYKGTLSLPFIPGKNQQIAVKIVDDRGVESLRVMGLGNENE